MEKKDLINLIKMNEKDGNALEVYFKAAEIGGATKEQALEAWYEYCGMAE